MTLYELITAAVADLSEFGYDGPERLERWIERLRAKIVEIQPSIGKSAELLNGSLKAIYERLVEKDGVLRNSKISRFTLERLKPSLRAELDRRIVASASLIRLNRSKSIEQTIQRFAGWATSIPIGGSGVVDKIAIKTEVRKPLSQLPYEERRVLIDQGHKLAASINDIVAEGGNAIAAEWFSHWRQKNYRFRKDHKERDGKFYAIRGSWAIEKGLLNKGEGYTDEITKPGEEIFCRCEYRYVYSLRDLPPEMLTVKGKNALDTARGAKAKVYA